MRSLIILEVEHGETTDPLNDIPSIVNLELASRHLFGVWAGTAGERPRVTNFAVRVNLPACFVLDSTHTD